MPGLIYTTQRSKLSKKQREAREALLKEQREIKRSLKKDVSKSNLVIRSSVPAGRSTDHIPSRSTGMGVAAASAPKVYTGDKVLGVAIMHKSNMVPVFKQEDAEDIAKMRRN